MTYEDVVSAIADLGLEGMEMTGYWLPPMLNFPPGTPSTQISELVRKTPANPTSQWLASLRNTAFKNGIDICSVGSPVKMAQPTPELRQKEIAFGKKWIDIADAVGASSVRVFGGGIAQGATETQAVKWAVEAYKPIIDYDAAKGIVLVLEDDDDLTRTSAQTDSRQAAWIIITRRFPRRIHRSLIGTSTMPSTLNGAIGCRATLHSGNDSPSFSRGEGQSSWSADARFPAESHDALGAASRRSTDINREALRK